MRGLIPLFITNAVQHHFCASVYCVVFLKSVFNINNSFTIGAAVCTSEL